MASGSTDNNRRFFVRIGKYEVRKHIATGGMGAVYRAFDPDNGREVALKVLNPELAVKPLLLQRFQREAQIACRLSHENIVEIFEFGEANGTYFLALEFVEGTDLLQYLNERGKLDPEEARQIMVQAARALVECHKENVVHRDIKPANFLITTKDGRTVVKLTDLGLARGLKDDEESRLTRDGTTVGTVDYLAPEQARNSSLSDIRSDIYSLGCSLYHLLAGHPPFPEGSLTERVCRHMDTDPPDIRGINPAVSPALAAVLKRMLAKEPADRYQTPLTLLRALEDPEKATAPQEIVRPLDVEGKNGNSTPLSANAGARKRKKAGPAEEKTKSTGKKEKFRKQSSYSSLLWVGAGAGVLAVGVSALLFALSTGKTPNPKEDDKPPPEPPVVHVVPTPTPIPAPKATEPEKVKIADKPAPPPVEPVVQGLPALYKAHEPLDPKRLREEFEGASAALPKVNADAPIFRVSRLPLYGPNTFRTLAEACAKAAPGQQTVIEIHDNGPLFEATLPRVNGRGLVIRAGKGYRPLVAWDPGPDTAEATPVVAKALGCFFLEVEQGSLTLEDLDVVVKSEGSRPSQPCAMFTVKQGSFAARNCTFSLAGSHPRGVAVVRLEGKTESRTPKCVLARCFTRGADLSLILFQDSSADALVDDSLAIGGISPHFLVIGGGMPTLRVVRSTLVAGKNVVRLQEAGGVSPGLKFFGCDSLFAQSNPQASDSALLQADPASLTYVRWRPVNCLYSGWPSLLSAGDQVITGSALEVWRKRFRYDEGDRWQFETWPRTHRPEPEDTPPVAFETKGTDAQFAAVTVPGPLGCDPSVVPPGRPLWLALTYDRVDVPLVSLPDADAPPPIPDESDGLYQGESLKLTRDVDLGAYLQAKLQTLKPGPRIVLHLTGTGEHPTSPIHLQGSSLVVYVQQPVGKQAPLVLVPGPKAGPVHDALIEVENGDVELLGVRITFPNSQFAPMPKHMASVKGGDLRLSGCHLQGPLGAAPESYVGLLRQRNGAKDTERGCGIQNSVLLSAKSVLSVEGRMVRLRMRDSLALSSGNLLHFDLGTSTPGRMDIQCVLRKNTLAARRCAFDVEGLLPAEAGAPLLIRAESNLFLDPFGDEAPQSCLLHCDPALVCRGLLLWQGKGNGFDRQHLHGYIAPGAGTPPAQPFQSWAALWGSPGEQHPYLIDLPKFAMKLSPPQLQRLALPRTLTAHACEPLPGAELPRLGIALPKN